ncbi:hypothetical protein GCM10023345_11490 [Acinetobacter kookii]
MFYEISKIWASAGKKKSSVSLRRERESLIRIEKKSRNRRFLLSDHRINTLQVEKEDMKK